MCEFCAMRIQVSRDDVRKEFVRLVRTYPKVVPILRDAFAGGRIIGSTYSDSWTGSRCILGWTAFMYPQAFIIQSPYYTTLEYFVRYVRPGETPETSAELAFLLSVLDEDETHPLPEVSSVAAVPSARVGIAVVWEELISTTQLEYTMIRRDVPVTRRAVPVVTPDGEAVWEERELVAT